MFGPSASYHFLPGEEQLATNRKFWGAVLSTACVAALSSSMASAGVIFTDGFGDGDRDNNGLDAGAVVTDVSDVGIAWYGVGGTSAITHLAVDESAGIGSGNAMQVNNTGSNNRPHVGPFGGVTLNDGDKLILRFDVRLNSLSVASANRAFRFGLYNDGGTTVAGDLGSTILTDQNDVGYMAEVDVGPDTSDSTAMDVKRDESASGTIIGGTAMTISGGPSSTNAANQLLVTSTGSSHFELTLTRVGADMLVSLQKDSNGVISNTDVGAPIGFTFNEVMVGPRSNAAMDLRFDNISVEYVLAPEPASVGLIGLAACGLGLRRKGR